MRVPDIDPRVLEKPVLSEVSLVAWNRKLRLIYTRGISGLLMQG